MIEEQRNNKKEDKISNYFVATPLPKPKSVKSICFPAAIHRTQEPLYCLQ